MMSDRLPDLALPPSEPTAPQLNSLAPFTARDGENLALYEWQDADGASEMARCMTRPRAIVLIVHGLGEHAGRYQHVAHQLIRWGFMVRAYDQRGHGESGGARGALPLEDTLLDDLAEVVDFSRGRCLQLINAASAGKPGAISHGLTALPPLILLGHSLGGLVASRFVALSMRLVEGLVLSSPALDAGLGTLQKLALAVAHRVAPALCVPNGLNTAYLSHDPEVIRQYLADPLVHNKISARLGLFLQRSGPPTIEAAARWRTPTLLMYAGADQLVNPAGSRAFATRAAGPGVTPGLVTARCFEDLYHELFNEPGAAAVFDTLKTWLDARFP
jgi:alpha-beta hydrolase superfamily lysophospholipase